MNNRRVDCSVWGLSVAYENNIYPHPGSAGQFPPTLQQGGGGGTYDGMDLVDAKIAAAEARTDAKFAEVLGELKAMRVEMSHGPSTWSMVATMGGFTAATIAIVLAALAYGGQMFGVGMDAQQVSERAVQAVQKANQPLQDDVRRIAEELSKALPGFQAPQK